MEWSGGQAGQDGQDGWLAWMICTQHVLHGLLKESQVTSVTYGRTDKHNECRTVFFASTIYNCMLTSIIILLQHFGSKLARVVQVTINILPSSTFQFKFASSLDCFLITLGVLFALCGGAGGPILMVMFGVTIQVLGIGIPFLHLLIILILFTI